MPVYSCNVGAGATHRAVESSLLVAAGTRRAIVCPSHGVIAWLGFKPNGGTLGVRTADGESDLAPLEITKFGQRFVIRPPRGPETLVAMLVTEDGSGVTVTGFIDTPEWRGWLEQSVWIEEQV